MTTTQATPEQVAAWEARQQLEQEALTPRTIDAAYPSYQHLWDSLPAHVQQKTREYQQKFDRRSRWTVELAYQAELANLLDYARHAGQPQIRMSLFNGPGPQWTCDFWVNDLAVPMADRYNWHGQNVSRWRYAGCILIDERDGEVSTHH